MNSATVLTAAHMERAAYVCVRQPSEIQVRNNVGRQRLRYALPDHAREPGFRGITVIDDDPGISGDGVHRPGFASPLEAVRKGKVGPVLSIEASGLSRNGPEWHTLLDFRAIVGCLVGDRNRLYDPALTDAGCISDFEASSTRWSLRSSASARRKAGSRRRNAASCGCTCRRATSGWKAPASG